MEFEFENHMHECVAMVKYFAKDLILLFGKKAPELKETLVLNLVLL